MSSMLRKPKTASQVPFASPLERVLGWTAEEERDAVLLALTHTPIEHKLYLAMLADVHTSKNNVGAFGIRRLMSLTNLTSYSSIQRGCAGLTSKLSIMSLKTTRPDRKCLYQIFTPQEIFRRRYHAGLEMLPGRVQQLGESPIFKLIFDCAARRWSLSRREALVTLYCSEGLSNGEISAEMNISEHTVKYHLKNIFGKIGVKRRVELVGRLLKIDSRNDRQSSLGPEVFQ